MGGNPSIALEDKGVVKRVVATAPNLEAGLQVEWMAGCKVVPMVAFWEVELFAPIMELKQNSNPIKL